MAISRVNFQPNTVLTSVELNSQLNDAFNAINSADGSLLISGTVEKSALVNGATANLLLTTKTSNYTVITSDQIVLGDTSGGSITFTLPTAVGNGGLVLFFKKTSSDSNPLVIDAFSSETIEGSLLKNLVGENDSIKIISNNTNWITLEKSGLNPVGTVLSVAFGPSSIPNGYLYCDGSAISRVNYSDLFDVIGVSHGYGDNSTTFNLPDYRGVFLRGQNNSSGNDPDSASRTALATGGNTGDNVGSYQSHQLQSHNHSLPAADGRFNDASGALSRQGTGTVSGSTGGNETRPKNVNVNYIIKY